MFKPGTVKQIRQVLAIAREVDTSVIAHIEGGVAGGHHSWEDLDELLLATYPDLRSVENLVVCVGGGIGTPERAVDYLTGSWAQAHGEAAMPVDGVLIGTAAMATKEATTTDSVKQLLVDTPGITGWVGAGRSDGGITSGRSQLGADIHEIDNAGLTLRQPARPGRRRPRSGHRTQGRARRGDGRDLQALLRRRRRDDLRGAAAALPRAGRADGGRLAGRHLPRPLRRAARPHPGTGAPRDLRTIERITLDDADPSGPAAAVDTLVADYPEGTSCRLHPADVHFFIEVCRRPGKPVNFVPVIDADVRRWWRSDSLWQAHDESYGADQVIVIPGPVAVGGITVKDEPVADLLDRFEAALVENLLGLDISPRSATSRSTVGADTSTLDAAFDSLDVVWAGRVVPNPLHRLEGVPSELVPDGDDAVLQVPLSHGAPAPARRPVRGLERPAAGDLRGVRHRGDGCPAGAHRRWQPARRSSTAPPSSTPTGPPDLVADHIGVTSPTRHPPRRRRRRPGGAGRARRARRTRLARRLRRHRPGRGAARPGPPGPPHRGGVRLRAPRARVPDRAEPGRHARRCPRTPPPVR